MMNKITLFCVLLLAFTAIQAQDKPEGLFINSKAPDFKLKDQSGIDVSSKELRRKGFVVVVFYRGNWCPYCNKELKRFQDSLTFLTEKGAQVVAISPEGPEGIAKTIEKTGAIFPVLHDEEMKVAKGYRVAYEVDERTASRYKSFGNDLLVINHQKGTPSLPIPAVYVVNKDGAVTYRFFEADYRKRPSVKEILEQIK